MMPYFLKSYGTVSSTNDCAKALALAFAPEWTAILARQQTKGRGRRQNSWESQQGGLYLSIILYPKNVECIQLLTFAASLAVLKSIREQYSLKPAIKWPNDVLLNGKKICGILTETSFGKKTACIVGIGLNINQKKITGQLSMAATSLYRETGLTGNIIGLARDIIIHFQEYYSSFEKKKFNKILNEWKRHCITLGKTIRVVSKEGTITGFAIGVTKEGMLLIKGSNGKMRICNEGEVSIR